MPEKTSPPKPARAKPARKPETGLTAKPAETTANKTAEGERIAKVLSRAGVASRREAERLIEAGEVKVNGKLVTSPALNVTARDKITVSGQPVGTPEPARLWLYYKPEGLVTSASDEKGRDTVFDHLPEDMPRVMSVGRLDLNSEGLLLLTNDGALKRQLELPSTGWLRKYRVRVKGNPTDPELDPLRKGITIEGEHFQPMDVVLDRHQGANAWLTVGLREGKNREIRRAMSAIGLTVNRLIRISYGPFRLNELKPGEVEEIRPRVLRDQLGALLPDSGDNADERAAPARGRARPAGKEAAPRGKSGASAGRSPASKPEARPRAANGAATGTSKPRASTEPAGRVTTAKGRDGLQRLSRAWAEATAPEGKGASGRPASPGRASGPSGAKPGGTKPTRAKPAGTKPTGTGPTGSKPGGRPSGGRPPAKPRNGR